MTWLLASFLPLVLSYAVLAHVGLESGGADVGTLRVPLYNDANYDTRTRLAIDEDGKVHSATAHLHRRSRLLRTEGADESTSLISVDAEEEHLQTPALNLVAFSGSSLPTNANPGWLVLNFKQKCMQYHPGEVWMLKASDCVTWKLQKWYFDGQKLRSMNDYKCVDHNTTDNKLHVSHCHQGNTQKWSVTSLKQLKSLSDNLPGQCLQYDTNDAHLGAVVLRPCSSNVLQKWTFKKMQSSGGLAQERKHRKQHQQHHKTPMSQPRPHRRHRLAISGRGVADVRSHSHARHLQRARRNHRPRVPPSDDDESEP